MDQGCLVHFTEYATTTQHECESEFHPFVLSPLKVKEFDCKCKSDCKQYAETNHNKTSNTQEIVPEPELIFEQLLYWQCMNTISKFYWFAYVSVLGCQESV